MVISGIKGNARASISDVSGRTVSEYYNISNNQTISDLDHLKAGIYLVKITEGNNQFNSKLLKK